MHAGVLKNRRARCTLSPFFTLKFPPPLRALERQGTLRVCMYVLILTHACLLTRIDMNETTATLSGFLFFHISVGLSRIYHRFDTIIE